MMRPRAEVKHIDFNVNFAGPLPCEFVRIPRVCTGLSEPRRNAIKFTSAGSVELSVRYVNAPRPCLEFDVIDTGAGMRREQLERLFVPFTQGDVLDHAQILRTGLGLAISRRLAEMLDGDVQVVSSRPDHGSHFRFRLFGGILPEPRSSIQPGRAPSIADKNLRRSTNVAPLAGCASCSRKTAPSIRD